MQVICAACQGDGCVVDTAGLLWTCEECDGEGVDVWEEIRLEAVAEARKERKEIA